VANEVEASGLIDANGHYYVVRADGTRHQFTVDDLPQPVAIIGTWELELDGGPKLPLADLGSWNDLAPAKNYSGWATYSISFEVPDLGRDLEWWLDLGSVHETAEASLNSIAPGGRVEKTPPAQLPASAQGGSESARGEGRQPLGE
jgi:hypothetical protein